METGRDAGALEAGREAYVKSSMEVGKGWLGDRSTGSWQRSIERVAWRLKKAGRETEALAAGREAYM